MSFNSLPKPSKFIGLWNNFYELAKKQNNAIPLEPLYFIKTPNSFSHHEDIVMPPADASYGRTFFEGELGIIIGKRCSQISIEEAHLYMEGFTCVNDFTVASLLTKDQSFAQWTRAKNFDGFGAFGPTIASGLKYENLRVQTLIDGKLMQDYSCQDMIFNPSQLVALISKDMTLEAGDIIACGTSVGSRPLREGSVIDVHIDGIGTLRSYFGIKKPEAVGS